MSMHRAWTRPSIVLAGVLALLAGCGGPGEDTDAARAADDTATTEAEAGTEAPDDAAIEDAVASLQRQGFGEAAARCVVDSVVAGGVPIEDLRHVDDASPPPEIMDAFGDAGMQCAAEIADQIPEGLPGLENPAVREQFVRTFAASSGVSTEVADCAAQYFIDNAVDYDDLIALAGGEQDPEIIAHVREAVESCS